ncbi:protein import receptor MAS20 [Suhomyces tanzawaensis NRRL Y-17324]|uniref:Mitochondrial import receptor subunit TOM20 n=1 Tax=Suhomyces tanzawaensis NRRL Y-17324 TaxID=984487 RepID=A0A1E4SD53_9ASCO|nr:protein import receptor MAS20 [Suhomyces tanzawaensis NRRL Y-17324]ODV77398.1 protein import receptor MAS20 [Suhomyces tanzawaensis NRRL Y-17324]
MNKALTITTIAATVFVGYAAYFDYQRRNSAEFRKSLKKKAVKHAKLSEKIEKETKKSKFEAVKKALEEDLKANPVPVDLAEKENFFMQQVALGEQLASLPDQKIESALCFYKALAVYPNPTDILGVYQRSVPEDIYEVVVMMIAAKPPPAVSNVLNPELKAEKPEEDLD